MAYRGTKKCERGEIGIHKGLKILRPNRLAGSSPAARTKKILIHIK